MAALSNATERTGGTYLTRCEGCRSLIVTARRLVNQRIGCPHCRRVTRVDGRAARVKLADIPAWLLATELAVGLGLTLVWGLWGARAVRSLNLADLEASGLVVGTVAGLSVLSGMGLTAIMGSSRSGFARHALSSGALAALVLLGFGVTASLVTAVASHLSGADNIAFHGPGITTLTLTASGGGSLLAGVQSVYLLCGLGVVMGAKQPERNIVNAEVPGGHLSQREGHLTLPVQRALDDLMEATHRAPGFLGLGKRWESWKAKLNSALVRRQYEEAARLIATARATYEEWTTTQIVGAEHQIRQLEMEQKIRHLEQELEAYRNWGPDDYQRELRREREFQQFDLDNRKAATAHDDALTDEWYRKRKEAMEKYADDPTVRDHRLAQLDAMYGRYRSGEEGTS